MAPDLDDLDDEIRGHLAISIKERIERGEDPKAARLAALKEFGNVTLTRDSMQGIWRHRWLEAAEGLGRLTPSRPGMRNGMRDPLHPLQEHADRASTAGCRTRNENGDEAGMVEGLVERYMADADFRAAVRKDPEGAIRAAGLELSDAEWAAVRSFDWNVSHEELMARASKSHMQGAPPWEFWRVVED